jgi:hypothetical protein
MKILLWALCIAGLGSVGLSGQSSPDFSGTWTMDSSRSEAAAQGTPIGPVTVAIRQTPGEIRIETTQNGTAGAVRYLPAGGRDVAADGSEGTFRWDGSRLITNLATSINSQAVTLMEVRRLNPAGTEMTVEVTLVVQHGYQSSGGGPIGSRTPPNSSTGTNVFVKAR